MGSSDLLTLFAELGAVIAGFSGIIVALDEAPLRAWSYARRESLRSLLQVSGVIIVFSLLPLFLGRRLAEPDLWTWALAVYGVAHLADVMSFLVRSRGRPNSMKVGAWLGLTIAIAQIVLVFIVAPDTAEMVYLCVLAWHLAIAAGSFVYLLYTHDE